MKRLKSFLGYTVAVLCLIITLLTFVTNEAVAGILVEATGIEVSPKFTGGKVISEIDHTDYKTIIHEAFFIGLLSPGKKGIVRVDWEAVNSFPDNISEDIDYDKDGKPDFHVVMNTKEVKAYLKPLSPNVISLGGTYKLKESYCIRVKVNNSTN